MTQDWPQAVTEPPLREAQQGSAAEQGADTLSRCLQSGVVHLAGHLGLQEFVKFIFLHQVLSMKQPSPRKWLNSTFFNVCLVLLKLFLYSAENLL